MNNCEHELIKTKYIEPFRKVPFIFFFSKIKQKESGGQVGRCALGQKSGSFCFSHDSI